MSCSNAPRPNLRTATTRVTRHPAWGSEGTLISLNSSIWRIQKGASTANGILVVGRHQRKTTGYRFDSGFGSNECPLGHRLCQQQLVFNAQVAAQLQCVWRIYGEHIRTGFNRVARRCVPFAGCLPNVNWPRTHESLHVASAFGVNAPHIVR